MDPILRALDQLFILVLGSYVFTAAAVASGAGAFFYLYRLAANHLRHRIERLEEHAGLDHE